MSATDATEWRRVSPLSVVFFLLQIAKNIARNLAQAVLPAVAVIATTGGFSTDRIYMFSAAALGVGILYAIALYLNLRYRFTDDAVIIRSGVFQKKQLNLEYGRIQAVNVSQNPVYRIFGVADLKLDSPGSASQEGDLPAVNPAVAEELRRLIKRAGPSKLTSADISHESESNEQEILRLGHVDMLRIGLTSNRVLVILAILGSAWGTMSDRFDELWLVPRINIDIGDVSQGLSGMQFIAAIVGIAFAVVLVLLVLSIIGALLRYHGYTLSSGEQNFTSRSGLLTVRSHSIGVRKIQLVRISRSIIHRALSRSTLRARQATSHAKRSNEDFTVPVVDAAQCADLTERFFDGEASDFDADPNAASYSPIHWRYMLSRFRVIGVLPALVMLGAVLKAGQLAVYWWIPAIWLVLAATVTWLRFRGWGIQRFATGLAVRRGMLGRYLKIILLRKIQAVTLRQNWFQKRRGLATLKLYTASGNITVPFLPMAQAEAIANDALKTVTETRKPWI